MGVEISGAHPEVVRNRAEICFLGRRISWGRDPKFVGHRRTRDYPPSDLWD